MTTVVTGMGYWVIDGIDAYRTGGRTDGLMADVGQAISQACAFPLLASILTKGFRWIETAEVPSRNKAFKMEDRKLSECGKESPGDDDKSSGDQNRSAGDNDKSPSDRGSSDGSDKSFDTADRELKMKDAATKTAAE